MPVDHVPAVAHGSPARPRRLSAQTRAIEADHRANETQAQQLVTGRVQAVSAAFGAARTRLTSTVAQVAAGFRSRVVAGQALLVAAVTAVVATGMALVSGAATALNARAAQSIGVVTSLVAGAVTAAQVGVRSVAGTITGLIDAVHLPDVPGVAAIRAGVVTFLAGAAGVLTATLDAVVSGVQAVAAATVSMVATLVSGAIRLVWSAVTRITTGLFRLVRTMTGLLLRLAAVVATALRTALAWTVLPLLRRVEGIIVGRLRWLLGHALRLLRRNRDQQLASLIELEQRLLRPRGGTTTDPTDPIDPGTAADAARVVADAVANSARVVRVLGHLTSGIVSGVPGLVRGVVGLVLSEIRRRLALAFARLVQVLAAVLDVVRRSAALVADMLRSVVAHAVRGFRVITDTARGLVQRPLDALVSLAAGSLSRLREAVTRMVTGQAAPTSQFVPGPVVGPILAPVTAPVAGGALVVLAGVLAWAAALFEPLMVFVMVVYVSLEAALLAGVGSLMAFLVALGLPEFWAAVLVALLVVFVVVVVVVIIVVIAAVVLLLVFLLVRTVVRTVQRNRRRRRRGKRVIEVTTPVREVGVAGRSVKLTAVIAPGVPPVPRLSWTINPVGVVPDGLMLIGSGLAVRLAGVHPARRVVTGGAHLVVRAALATDASDFEDSPDIMVVQVRSARYVANPRLRTVGTGLGRPPVGSVDPNREKVSGSIAWVVTTTAPEGRAVTVELLAPLGASLNGTTITPGETTGDIRVRIRDSATGALLDGSRRSALRVPMDTLVVNAVPVRVSALTFKRRVEGGFYGAVNRVDFEPSDTLHPPLARIVGELLTLRQNQFGVPPPNEGWNDRFDPDLAAPAFKLEDRLSDRHLSPIDGTRQPAIDVNRFVGPGVPSLPRSNIYRQQVVWAAWREGDVASKPFAEGEQVRTLFQQGDEFLFTTHQFLGHAQSTPDPEEYAGPPLIVLTRMAVVPAAAGASALAADGSSTGGVVVSTTAPNRRVDWVVISGDIVIAAGNPSVPPGAVTVRAGLTAGQFRIRAADRTHPNRQLQGIVRVDAVRLLGMVALPPDGSASVVTVLADPGGRTLSWRVDPLAMAAGVTVTLATTEQGGRLHLVRVTRPAGFVGAVMVTAVDSVLAASRASTSVVFI